METVEKVAGKIKELGKAARGARTVGLAQVFRGALYQVTVFFSWEGYREGTF